MQTKLIGLVGRIGRIRLFTAAMGVAAIIGIGIGCSSLTPGADPLVVRVEQTLTGSSATFDFVLGVDNANRAFWVTNGPAFHQFCEFLRTPQPYKSVTVPRCVAMELNVDDLKLAYQDSKTTGNSNALWSAWSVLSTAITQTASWSNIVAGPVHP
jgi:hypothetical protein